MFRVLFFFIICQSVYAQKVFSPYPFQYDQFPYQLNVLNPAIVSKDSRFIQTGYNGFNQLSSNIASYYLNARYSIGKDSNYRKQVVGVFVSNDKEGEYLGRLRFLAQYAYKIYFSDQSYMASGLSLGFINNALKPNPVTGGESIYATEIDVGLSFNHKERFSLGLSLNQIINRPIPFYNGSYTRVRYISLITSYQLPISYTTKLKTTLFYRTGLDQYNKYALHVAAVYKGLFVAGMALKSGNGLIPMIGVTDIPVFKEKFGFMFSFRFPTSKIIRTGTGNAEIMVEYKF